MSVRRRNPVAVARLALMVAAVAVLALPAQPVLATPGNAAVPPDPAARQDRMLREVDLSQRLGERVPLDVPFVESIGTPVLLGDFFDGRTPVVVVLAYAECPMLCGLVRDDVAEALRGTKLEPGPDFRVVVVSIDPRETPERAAQAKRMMMNRFGRTDAPQAWHFLTGEEPQIRRLADAVGYRYALDPVTREYAHPAGAIVLTGEGVVSRYLYGTGYPPRDMRLALVEASQGRIGSAVDQVLLRCYRYDPMTGRYGLMVARLLKIGGALTVVGMVALVGGLIRLDRRRRSRGVTP